MITKHFKSLLFAVIGVFYALTATAAISVFSEYGLIQNVQNYSTNPFWSPNAPYNQRLPQPVYVQGADLNADDCINVVQSLVSVQCMARDNCKNAELSDVRPAIMVQLSNLPGANYVSSCSGYIDGIFESYKRQYANTLPNRPTAFPDATVPNPDLNDDDGSIKFENPYKRQTPKWQQEQNERAAELQALQRQNGVGGEHVQYTDFPATYADLSFSERIENDRAGQEPFKDLKAYKTLDVKTESEWCNDGHIDSPECAAYKARVEAAAAAQAAAQQQNNPQNGNNDGNNTTEEQAAIDAIVTFLNPQTQQEKKFFTDLATDFVKAESKDHSLFLDNEYIFGFLAQDDNLEKYKPVLTDKHITGTIQDEDLKIDIDWDQLLIDISELLDATMRKRGALVCENNRSYQVGIDAAWWTATIAAAIPTGGVGSGIMAGGRAAIGIGLRAMAKGALKIGWKSAAKTLVKASSKQLAKAGVKRIVLKQGVGRTARRIVRKKFYNLSIKRRALAAAGILVYPIGQHYAKTSNNSLLYSLVESDESTEILNCQDIDKNEGCYAICGDGTTDDDLNTKVFKPIFGKTYCVDRKDFVLYETGTKKPLLMSPEESQKVAQTISDQVKDQGKFTLGALFNVSGSRHGCDWNEDDIDMYIGTYIYDPDTLEPSSNLVIEEIIRIDD